MLGFTVALAMLSFQPSQPGPGVSAALAQERAESIGELRYDLSFTVPRDRRQPVRGRATVRFEMGAPRQVVFDFAQPADRLLAVTANGQRVPSRLVDGHIVLPLEQTRAGTNRVEFEFLAGDEALNRSDDFLYSLFVPARARLTFPCFDQPDLKARYSLTLTVPEDWRAVANGAEIRREPGAGSLTFGFAETQPLPTYVFGFAAGRFSLETGTRAGRTLRMFHRETDAAKVARNRDAIFDLHASALSWLEDYTAIPYPWGKFDIIAIPSFQFSGMEHAAAILYNASDLMLDQSATQNQQLDRANVIAHETAHMWFGDLVTMRWFNDVWTKEVFANFMAAKIVNPSFPQMNHDLRFLMSHYPGAYQVDRTEGTNAIRQELANLDEAGQMYGPIIYQKAPIVMRQLEMMVGPTQFRDGLREYLKRFAYGNATWSDLVAILDRRTPRNVAEWSRAWVEERGRPEFTSRLELDANGRMTRLTLTQDDPRKRGLVWPQQLSVALGYDDTVREVPVTVATSTIEVTAAKGLPAPRFILPAGGGLGYGLFILDAASRQYLLEKIETVSSALTRGAAWVTLWENLQVSRVDPSAFMDTGLRALSHEDEEQNVQRVLTYLTRVFWRFLPPAERTARSSAVEISLRAGLARAKTQSEKAAWFNAYRDVVLSPEGIVWLTRVWKRDEHVPGLVLAEPDEIALAMELAVREAPGWEEILRVQHERTQNPDRKARFAFVMPALSADPAVREAAFERFRLPENRRREAWVLECLRYLNHPMRQAHARRFVQPALELLREIQRTGDIFFPTRWMDSTLWGHRSPDAAQTVRDFLARERDYPQRLTWTILTTADELFRVARQP